jgi:hypothetical protein
MAIIDNTTDRDFGGRRDDHGEIGSPTTRERDQCKESKCAHACA